MLTVSNIQIQPKNQASSSKSGSFFVLFLGITWSTVTKFMSGWPNIIPEPYDRIDFIYFKESLFDVTNAFTYCGNSSLKVKRFFRFN